MIHHTTSFLFAVVLLSSCAVAFGDEYADFYENYEASRTNQPTMVHRVPRGRYYLHANDYQPGRAERRAPIVLMHGFPDSSHLYDRLAPLLATHQRVVSFDFLGWGKSDKPSSHIYNLASLATDLEAIIEYFAFQRVMLVVHDLSGPTGIDWALANPERVETLVLLNTIYARSEAAVPPPVIQQLGTPGLFNRGLLAFGIRLNAGRFQRGLIDQVSEFFFDANVRDEYVKLFAHQAPAIRPAFLGMTKRFFQEIDARKQRLPDVQVLDVPTKIIFGAEDPFLNVNVAREFEALFPLSRLHLIDEAGHYVQLDRPEAVAEAVLRDASY